MKGQLLLQNQNKYLSEPYCTAACGGTRPRAGLEIVGISSELRRWPVPVRDARFLRLVGGDTSATLVVRAVGLERRGVSNRAEMEAITPPDYGLFSSSPISLSWMAITKTSRTTANWKYLTSPVQLQYCVASSVRSPLNHGEPEQHERAKKCVPAEPHPPLSSAESGITQLRRAMIFHRTALTPLTLCLTRGVHCKIAPAQARGVNPGFSNRVPRQGALHTRLLVASVLLPRSGSPQALLGGRDGPRTGLARPASRCVSHPNTATTRKLLCE
jgi:hypothetical protein